jgi:hypothetical protein
MRGSITCSPVTGLTPPSASVAPITARSLALTRRQHCCVYSSTASADGQYTRSKLSGSRAMLWLRESSRQRFRPRTRQRGRGEHSPAREMPARSRGRDLPDSGRAPRAQALYEGALRQLASRDKGVASGTIDCARHINPPARQSTNARLPTAGPDGRTTAVAGAVWPQAQVGDQTRDGPRPTWRSRARRSARVEW